MKVSVHRAVWLWSTLWLIGCVTNSPGDSSAPEDGGVEEPEEVGTGQRGDCNDMREGETETREAYREPFVLATGEGCQAEVQYSTCQGGRWTRWTGSYQNSSCSIVSCIQPAVPEYRFRYRAPMAVSPETCESEIQVKVCRNGVVSWPTEADQHEYASCEQVLRSCTSVEDAGVEHGQMETRIRFTNAMPAPGSSCQAETQTRVCNDGAWSLWSGSYQAETCSE